MKRATTGGKQDEAQLRNGLRSCAASPRVRIRGNRTRSGLSLVALAEMPVAPAHRANSTETDPCAVVMVPTVPAAVRALAGGRHASHDRVLATMLFTDVVGATELAVALGDRGWRELLDRHHAMVRRELAAFRGQEIDCAGDGFFVSFDGPARAIRAAQAITAKARLMGVDLRAGLHSGECEIIGPKLVGIAVHIGARVAALANAGEVLVSNTVKDLVAGSGLKFEDRGAHTLKGVPGEWRLYAVSNRSYSKRAVLSTVAAAPHRASD